MKLRPSEYKLVAHDGGTRLLPLWDRLEATDSHPARLIWVVRGVEGDKMPAGLASGKVSCCLAEPTDVVGLGGGCPPEGIEVERVTNIEQRDVIVRAPDGVLESATIMVTEKMKLR